MYFNYFYLFHHDVVCPNEVAMNVCMCVWQHAGGRFPRFTSREMEAMHIEELRSSVNLLMANLESMPVSKGGEFKLQKLKRGHNASIMDMGQEDENTLSKSDVVLSFTLEVGGLKLCQLVWNLVLEVLLVSALVFHGLENLRFGFWFNPH